MRRVPLIAAAVLAAAALAIVLTSGSSSYQVAAIFDSAKGMVAGQQVKIAGVHVGTVQAVELAAGPKARIVMSIESRFAPFHSDASCEILPEGLISENFVECNPGTAGPALARGPGGLPTVPLGQTSVPVSLQDVLNTFSVPTDDRVGVLLAELGIATAGRGEDLNALLRRADPALAQSQRALAIVDAQRRQLAEAVSATDQVIAQLASRSQRVRAFVDRAAAVLQTTALHGTPLGEAVNRLPALLGAARPGLRAVDRAASNAAPLLDQLRAAAPGLDQLTRVLPQFTATGVPAVRTLAAAARSGIPAVHAAAPVIARLNTLTTPLATLATGLDRLLVSSREEGAFEGVARLSYTLATVASMYDNTSHMITFLANVSPLCVAASVAGPNLAGCSHTYTAPDQGRIPINEPSCHPADSVWWTPACPQVVGPVALPLKTKTSTPTLGTKLGQLLHIVGQTLAGKSPPKQSLQSLLTYLLK